MIPKITTKLKLKTRNVVITSILDSKNEKKNDPSLLLKVLHEIRAAKTSNAYE